MEGARAVESRKAPVALSAAEEDYLRRFVRRHALSGAAGKGLVACVMVALGLALWPARVLPPAPPQAPSAPGALALAADVEAIRSEVAARSQREASDPATQAAVAELARRIEAIAREIDALRSRPEVVPAAPPARAPVPVDTGIAGDEDASSLRLLLDRVEQLERSRDVAEASRLQGQNAILDRLAVLESRIETVPAAPAH